MAIANIHETLLLYTIEKADLTDRLSTIMGRLTMSSKNGLEMTQGVYDKRSQLADYVKQNPAYADTSEYEVLEKQITADYQLQLSEIDAWECQLQQEKNSIESRLKVIEAFEENWTQVLKGNIKRDFSYFQTSQ